MKARGALELVGYRKGKGESFMIVFLASTIEDIDLCLKSPSFRCL